jgi:hypothetical protein
MSYSTESQTLQHHHPEAPDVHRLETRVNKKMAAKDSLYGAVQDKYYPPQNYKKV